MATIYAPTSPLARCAKCGSQRQFHTASAVPHSADRDHEFVAETIDDFDAGDLTPEQLVDAIDGATSRWGRLLDKAPMTEADWKESDRLDARAKACRVELRARVRTVLGVSWDDLLGSLEG